jgi:hypothetical protein
MGSSVSRVEAAGVDWTGSPWEEEARLDREATDLLSHAFKQISDVLHISIYFE